MCGGLDLQVTVSGCEVTIRDGAGGHAVPPERP